MNMKRVILCLHFWNLIVICWPFFFVSLDFPPCGSGEFQCSNQVCIDEKQRCDGKTDCDDNTDETKCGNYSNFLTLMPIFDWNKDFFIRGVHILQTLFSTSLTVVPIFVQENNLLLSNLTLAVYWLSRETIPFVT